MALYSKSNGRNAAKEILVASLSSGAVKLIGPYSDDYAEANGKADALYLSTLFKEFSEKISNEEP
jgi:hypothetical protein